MPEASLARELDMLRVLCCGRNWAAGRGDGPITMREIEEHLTVGMKKCTKTIKAFYIYMKIIIIIS